MLREVVGRVSQRLDCQLLPPSRTLTDYASLDDATVLTSFFLQFLFFSYPQTGGAEATGIGRSGQYLPPSEADHRSREQAKVCTCPPLLFFVLSHSFVAVDAVFSELEKEEERLAQLQEEAKKIEQKRDMFQKKRKVAYTITCPPPFHYSLTRLLSCPLPVEPCARPVRQARVRAPAAGARLGAHVYDGAPLRPGRRSRALDRGHDHREHQRKRKRKERKPGDRDRCGAGYRERSGNGGHQPSAAAAPSGGPHHHP
jgi:hypothetical protein